MIPSRFEYFCVLAVVAMATLSIFWDVIHIMIRRFTFWSTFIVFYVLCIVIDYWAINLQWWTFNDEKIIGVTVITIPIEEYMLFALALVTILGIWEFTALDRENYTEK